MFVPPLSFTKVTIITVTKWKDSLETRVKRVRLRAYVENQAITEPILLYRASKYKQTKRLGY